MTEKAYLLVDAVKDKADNILNVLPGQPGISIVERVDGPPDVVIVAEASEPLTLARLVIQAMSAIDTLTERIEYLPVRNH